jgi:hypothetical protein
MQKRMKKTITQFMMGALLLLGLNAAQAQVVLRITSPASLAGSYINAQPADWGGRITSEQTWDGIVVNDGSAQPTLGCNASPANAYNGKLALVRRGSCEFGQKALNAQNAGAGAVLVVNNAAGPPPGMAAGTVGAEVTVPALSVSQEDGERMIAALDAGETVTFTIYPASFVLAFPFYPSYYAAVPECFNRESVDSMGIFVTNNSGRELADVVVRYQFVNKDNGSVLAQDSMMVPALASGVETAFEWDLSSTPIDISGLEKGTYAFEYSAYYAGDQLDPPGTYRTSQEFRVTDGLWSHENVVSNSFRPSDGGDHTDGGLFTIPEDVATNKPIHLKTVSFISANNATETTMAGKDVIVFVSKIISDQFDFNLSIFDESQFELLGYAEFTFSDEAQRFQRIELPIRDIETDEEGIVLDPGFEYIATVSYNGPSNQLFHGYSLELTYPSSLPITTSLVYGNFSGTTRWVSYVNTISGKERRINNSIRLGIELEECTISSNEEQLAENQIRIFPNPVKDFVQIQFDLSEPSDVSAILTDMNGRVIRWNSYKGIQNDQVSFDAQQLPAGHYLMHFSTKNGQRAEKLVVIK